MRNNKCKTANALKMQKIDVKIRIFRRKTV